MGNIRQESQAYEPKTTRNIADLDVVDIEADIKSDTFPVKKKDKETNVEYVENVTIEYIIAGNNERYRIPLIVKKQLKEHLAENPKLKWFKVRKKGTGLATEYTVIPLLEKPKQTKQEDNVPVEEVK